MEGQIINKSLDFVRERVTEELKAQLVDLQQYTRRYSVVIAGVRTGIDERITVEAILKEAASSTKKVSKIKKNPLKCDHHLPQKEENS